MCSAMRGANIQLTVSMENARHFWGNLTPCRGHFGQYAGPGEEKMRMWIIEVGFGNIAGAGDMFFKCFTLVDIKSFDIRRRLNYYTID